MTVSMGHGSSSTCRGGATNSKRPRGGDTQKGVTAIHRDGHHQAFFNFDTGEERGAGSPGPIAGNMHGGGTH